MKPVWVSMGDLNAIAEYGSILDKDAMMKGIENHGPFACGLDVGSSLEPST